MFDMHLFDELQSRGKVVVLVPRDGGAGVRGGGGKERKGKERGRRGAGRKGKRGRGRLIKESEYLDGNFPKRKDK